MASITLNGVWLAPASDLSNPILAGSVGSMGASSSAGSPRSMAYSTKTVVGQYSSGRFRAVTIVGTSQVYTCTMRMLTATQVATIVSWLGQVLLIRDRTGRRIWGVIAGLTVSDYPNSQLHDGSFTFTGVTYSESV